MRARGLRAEKMQMQCLRTISTLILIHEVGFEAFWDMKDVLAGKRV